MPLEKQNLKAMTGKMLLLMLQEIDLTKIMDITNIMMIQTQIFLRLHHIAPIVFIIQWVI